MTRRCSHCSNNGHNSRTCPFRHGGCGGVKLFGVRLTEGVGAIKKSASMGSLSSAATAQYAPSSEAGSLSFPDSPSADQIRYHAAEASGYASDDPGHASCSFNSRNERKKGITWTEEEHRMFLLGLQKLGKGDWRGIARNFVVSRTPTQVASHAQKYFIRHTNVSRRKRRYSLFDIVPKIPMDQVPAVEDQPLLDSLPNEPENADKLHPSIRLGYAHQSQLTETSSRTSPPLVETNENIPLNNVALPLIPTFYPTLFPVPIQFWPPNLPSPVKEEEMSENHEVLKPIPVLCKDHANADEIVGILNLTIGVVSRMEPSALSIELLDSSASRQSAFNRNPSISRPGLSQNGSNMIHAV